MPLSTESSIALYADPTGASIEEQLADALARNVAGGLVISNTTTLENVAYAALEQANHAATVDIPRDIGLNFLPIVEASLQSSEDISERIGVDSPQLGELIAADINFDRLRGAHEIMMGIGQEPELVIAPVLSPESWRAVYQSLEDDVLVNHDKRIRGGGLYIANEITENWSRFHPEQEHDIILGDLRWHIMIISATDKPPLCNIFQDGLATYNDPRKTLDPNVENRASELDITLDELRKGYINPTIAAYLTLQATRLQNGSPPLDTQTDTWLQGTFNNKSRAATSIWNPRNGRVELNSYVVERRAARIGTRLPVWGKP